MKKYDYIIVGAGSAGCVLADRLSRSGRNRILVVESGPPDKNILIDIPRGFGKLLMDQKYTSVHVAQKGQGQNEPEYWIRGKVLGGSSSVNGLVYMRGMPSDFDEWEENGCHGWGWNDLKRCFLEMEDHQLGASDMRGAGGPLKITPNPERKPFLDAAIAAAKELGIPYSEDLNELDGVGIGYQPRTIFKGRRQSAARAFLKTARERPNVDIRTNTDVDKVVFDGKCAVGVETIEGAEKSVVYGEEIILSAGALDSPQILQRSGVGDSAHLSSLGIETIDHRPAVGKNMREHRLLNAQFRLHKGSDNAAFCGLGLWKTIAQYGLFRTGPLSLAAFEVGGFIRTEPGEGRTDAQIGMGPFSLDRSIPGFNMEKEPGALCGGFVQRPESQGHVKITSSDRGTPADINANYLSTDYDRRVSVGLFRKIREIFSQPSLKPFVIAESSPGLDVSSDDEILDAFMSSGAAGYHAAGTCRMGSDEGSVVDTHTRVRGVEKLRVVDLSIMPSLVSGNTNAPVMAMAWRAAELIAQDSA